jgi:hypothetical protein
MLLARIIVTIPQFLFLFLLLPHNTVPVKITSFRTNHVYVYTVLVHLYPYICADFWLGFKTAILVAEFTVWTAPNAKKTTRQNTERGTFKKSAQSCRVCQLKYKKVLAWPKSIWPEQSVIHRQYAFVCSSCQFYTRINKPLVLQWHKRVVCLIDFLQLIAVGP